MTKFLAATLLASTLTGCMIGDAGEGNNDEDIIGGSVDTSDTSVVMVKYRQNGGLFDCTATVIAPYALLTAGHCAGGYAYQYSSDTTPNISLPFPGTVLTIVQNPQYTGDPGNGGHDMSIIILGAKTSLPVRGLGTAPAVGQTVRAVGYGWEGINDTVGQGTRMQKNFQVHAISGHEWSGGPTPTCHGDSGGPVFDASGNIVGTTSYGPDDCNGDDHFMRIDDNRAWINSVLSQYSIFGK